MQIGDVVINPFVNPLFNGKPNPMYKSMITHIGSEYTTCLRIDGKSSKYYTSDVREWKVSHRVDFKRLIVGE
jgi:hypothetical protein